LVVELDAIVCEEVRKRFGEVEALRGVSHTVPKGEIHVLLGPNGSGKSTLMKIAAGVLYPDGGRVLVYGKEPYRDFSVKGMIGYAPQEYTLYEMLTGLENYMFYAGLEGVSKREALEQYGRLRETLELGEWFEKRKVKTYSGGMARKASIAVALASDPEVLILDEPTTGLDPDARRKLWDALLKLKREKTLIVATHIFEDAEVLADKVVIMHRGEIKAVGEVDELKRKAEYSFAVDLELMEEPSREVEQLIHSSSEIVVRTGFTYRLYTNDPSLMPELKEKLAELGVRLLKLELRHISLADVYFMVTGVRLE